MLKLNTSFLKETEYINQIRETIEQVKLEYQEDKYVNPALMWEMIKLKIREKSIRYAKSKRSRMLREEEQLESLVNNLQKDIEVTGALKGFPIYIEHFSNRFRLKHGNSWE